MNKHDAHLFLPLVQALAEGKTIQIRVGNKWTDIDDPHFGNVVERYRIKPELVTAYAILRKDGLIVWTYRDVVEAEQTCRNLNADNHNKHRPYRVITLVEKENNNGNC